MNRRRQSHRSMPAIEAGVTVAVVGTRAKPSFVRYLRSAVRRAFGLSAHAMVVAASVSAAMASEHRVLVTDSARQDVAAFSSAGEVRSSPHDMLVVGLRRDGPDGLARLVTEALVRAGLLAGDDSQRKRAVTEMMFRNSLSSSLAAVGEGQPAATVLQFDLGYVDGMMSLPERARSALVDAMHGGVLDEHTVEAFNALRQASMARSQVDPKARGMVCFVLGEDIPTWWGRHWQEVMAGAPEANRDLVVALASRVSTLFDQDEISRIVWEHELGHCLDANLNDRVATGDDAILRREQFADLFALTRAIRGRSPEQAIRIANAMVLWRASATVIEAMHGKPFDSLTHRTEVALRLFIEGLRKDPERMLAHWASMTPERAAREIGAWLETNSRRIGNLDSSYRRVYETLREAAAGGPSAVQGWLRRTQPRAVGVDALLTGLVSSAVAVADHGLRVTMHPIHRSSPSAGPVERLAAAQAMADEDDPERARMQRYRPGVRR